MQTDATSIAVAPPATVADNIDQRVMFVEKADMKRLLEDLLEGRLSSAPEQLVASGAEVRAHDSHVPADADQLRQVAINLLLNAGSAMPEGGAIRVSTMLDEDHYIRIEFADNGDMIIGFRDRQGDTFRAFRLHFLPYQVPMQGNNAE